MSETDRIRIGHMRDAAREAISFVEGRTMEDLSGDRQLALALVKELEIIGEAAVNVSPEPRQSRPEIPWAVIMGMRNRLIHAYFEVNREIVWLTVTTKLPELAVELDRLLAEAD